MQTALRFFEGDGRFKSSASVEEVFATGPGAVIKLLLESKPDLSATDSRFSLVLQMAATIGNAEYIRLLVEREVDVNAPGHFFGHAIIAAGRFGHIDCVRLLITAGADVNMAHQSHGTVLQAATIGGHTEIARTLLGHGIDLNTYRKSLFASIDPANAPALHLAIICGSFDIANLLLDAGADVSISPPFVSPPLLGACARGDVEFVKRLLQQGANVNTDGQKRESSSKEAPVADEEASALHKACAEGRDDLVPIFLEKNADIEKRVGGSLTPLEVAAKAGQLAVLDQLLDAGAAVYDPSRGVNALRAACRGKDPIPSIRLLRQRLKAGSTHFASAFDEAVPAALREGYGDLLVCLVQDLPKRPSLLHHACVLGSTDAVELILNHGVDVNVNFDCGGQPLHVACYYQRPQLVPLLIKRGATIHEENLGYGTPIQAALEGYIASSPRIDRKPFHDMFSIQSPLQTLSKNDDGGSNSAKEDLKIACESNVLALVSAGAKADAEGRPLGPPLHLAAYIGSIPVIRLFLQAGVDINTPGGYFGSALLAAVYAQQQDTIAYLLDQGIDANIFSANHGTALHLACRQGDRNKTRTVRTLLEHRADVNANGSKSESPLSALLSSNMTGYMPEIAEDTLEIILQTATGLKVRPEDLILAVTVDDDHSRESCEEMTERLLRHDSTAQVTFDVISHAAKCRGLGNTANRLAMLLHRSNGIYVTESILKSASSPKILEVLLRYTPRCEVTDAVFETLARSSLGRECVKTLLDQDPSAIPTVAVITGFLETQFRLKDSPEFINILKMLFDRNPNIEVTEEMLAAAMYPAEREILRSRVHKRAGQ
jgi:ankyrin repeat protein